MSKSIPTVRRAKWHRKSDKWQVQNEDGELCSLNTRSSKPPVPSHSVLGRWDAGEIPGFWASSANWKSGPKREAPADYTKTLRRIIDAPKDKRVPNKKRKA